MGQGCVRYRHLSLPTSAKADSLYPARARGKQAHNRSGFDWAVRARFSSGFCWGEHWLRERRQLDDDVAAPAGFCFTAGGAPPPSAGSCLHWDTCCSGSQMRNIWQLGTGWTRISPKQPCRITTQRPSASRVLG